MRSMVVSLLQSCMFSATCRSGAGTTNVTYCLIAGVSPLRECLLTFQHLLHTVMSTRYDPRRLCSSYETLSGVVSYSGDVSARATDPQSSKTTETKTTGTEAVVLLDQSSHPLYLIVGTAD